MQTARIAMVLVGVVLAAGCGNSGGGSSSAVVAKLRTCDLITAGDVELDPIESEADVCAAECIEEASCDVLGSLFCDNNFAPLIQCVEDCVGDFVCGSGESIPGLEECNGVPDCEDDSDEIGCPFFDCATTNESIPEDFQCDGEEDCEDGSDEDGCPTFACGSGELVPATYVCDLQADCEDGSDEDGCAELLCD